MNISIIIPNYNGAKLLENNLPFVFDAVKNHDKGWVELIIIDDASTDNSKQVIKDVEKKINNKKVILKIIENKNNLGFSPSINKASSHARGDIFILLNTDIRPRINFLPPLLKHFEREDVFAVGCMDESIEGEQVILRGRGIGTFQRGFLIHARGEVNHSNTLWVNGGSGAFRATVWRFLGGFHEIYKPFYWEDIDLSYRALKAGYIIVFESQSVVVHEHEQGAIKRTHSQKEIDVISYRNQILFSWINISDRHLLFSHVVWFPYHVIVSILRGNFSFIGGFFQASSLFSEALSTRRKTQKLVKRTDAEVINKSND